MQQNQPVQPRTGKPRLIVDMRCRPRTKEYQSIGDNPMFKAMPNVKKDVEPVEETVATCKKLGIVHGVTMARDMRRTCGFHVSNEYVADLVKKFPDFFIGIASVDPGVGAQQCIDELKRAHQTLGLRGVSLDPYMMKMPCDDKACYSIYEYLQKNKQPCFITTDPGVGSPGMTLDDVHPIRVDRVCRDFPEMKMLNSHACSPWVRDNCMMAMRRPNYYYECSPYEPFPGSEEFWAWANLGATSQRHCFASATPYGSIELAVPLYEQIPMLPEVRERIMWQNADEFFGLGLEDAKVTVV